MTILITGANRGLGFETAKALAADTTLTLILAGRDQPGLDQAAGLIQSATGNQNLRPMFLDLASLAKVRDFAAKYRALALPPLAILICNAAVSKTSVAARSADGYELAFAVNHLGHFLLVHLLLDQISGPGRIHFVSSGAHDPARANGPMQVPRYVKTEWLAYPERDPEQPATEKIAGGQAYATSKLCNVLTAFELARQLEARGLSTPEKPITANASNPGLMAGTGLGRDERGMTRFMWYHVLPFMSRFIPSGRTTAESGTDLAYLVTAPELAGVTGRYFNGREMVPSSIAAQDPELAADLWNASIALAHLQPGDSPLI